MIEKVENVKYHYAPLVEGKLWGLKSLKPPQFEHIWIMYVDVNFPHLLRFSTNNVTSWMDAFLNLPAAFLVISCTYWLNRWKLPSIQWCPMSSLHYIKKGMAKEHLRTRQRWIIFCTGKTSLNILLIRDHNSFTAVQFSKWHPFQFCSYSP